MLKPSIWEFNNPAIKSYEAMLSLRKGDSVVLSSQGQSEDGSTDPTAKLIGQNFLIALSDELQRRSLITERVVMRTFVGTERIRRRGRRTRVEIDIIIAVPGATKNQLIDALAATKRRCSAWAGPAIKIVLKAELRAAGSDPDRGQPAYLNGDREIEPSKLMLEH